MVNEKAKFRSASINSGRHYKEVGQKPISL
jgi:hypothetical protein